MKKDNIDLLINGAESLGVNLQLFHVEQFIKYYDLLMEWNQKMNLTAITEERDVVIKHFLDSLTAKICKKINGNEKIIDIGAGAGFPSIPLKILYPSLKLTIIDSLKKRTVFLNELVQQLHLNDVEIIHGRAEDLGKDNFLREKFDISLSRAVAQLNILLEYCIPFVKIDGYLIAYKGSNVDEEISMSNNALNILNSKIENVFEVTLPYTDIVHKLLLIRKLGTTDMKYPRKPKLIEKMPL
ncbi:MAG: rRNA (guanine527-N7)-methyltransferase [Thermoanaerobacterium sp.]|nr:rRNA (guanine527-N7)-methyltransferase [Thermoanaerobacterium sp.]MDN5317624.1 rRNA (guanine527-N7)-methyltransferase [Thermoanaerobacterium sp.]